MFICNKCKKIFPDMDGYGMRMQYRFCYGSAHDNDMFDLSICNDCADSMAEVIEKACAISPIVECNDDAIYGCGDCCDDCDPFADDGFLPS